MRSRWFAACSDRNAGIQHLVLRPADRPEDGAWPELAGERHILFAQDLLHERLLVVRVVDDEATIDPDRLAIRAQHPGTQRVERAGLDVTPALADEADDPLAQLRGGPVREGHGQDPPRGDALDADEVGDAMGEHAGLARTRPGEDQQRPIGRGDGARLLGIERFDDLGGTCLASGGDRLGIRGGDRDRGVGGRVGSGRLGHPGRLVGHRGGLHRLVREGRPGRLVEPKRGDVGRGVAGSATSGRAHWAIVEPGA